MKTATTFSSGFVTCLAAVSIACGGGGSDSVIETAEGPLTVSDVCEFASSEDMQRAKDAGVVCRVYVVASKEEA